MLYDRRHTRLIAEFGGLATPVPILSALFLVATFSSIGLPLLNSFVGEFLILTGAAQANFTYVIIAVSAVILSAVYMLWMYQRVFLGEVTHAENSSLLDLSAREKWVLVPVLLMALYMGLASSQFFKPMEASTARVLPALTQRVQVGK